MALNKVEICGVNTSKLPLLTNDEKKLLFERIKKGDQEAREIYIKGNLRLVLSVIQRFSSSNENVVTVDEDGYLEALKEGRVTITVKNPASGVKATCTVRVREE